MNYHFHPNAESELSGTPELHGSVRATDRTSHQYCVVFYALHRIKKSYTMTVEEGR